MDKIREKNKSTIPVEHYDENRWELDYKSK